ncbi:MAG TPA: diadenylate cyclase CdaA [Bacteroidales bacterium]|nr:diadenylate cyclase CdaA [Bacteroidales bacterium]
MLLKLTLFDIIDILLVAIILYQIYRLIRGTAAFSISIAILGIYLFWLIVKALNMELVESLLGQVIGVGVIALIIVFQQEIRRFLIVIGNRYISSRRFSIERFLDRDNKAPSGFTRKMEEIVRAAESMSVKNTGALIIIGRSSGLGIYAESGEILNARISAELLETIFFKNSPLHDGAVLIEGNLILAARCTLPITDQITLPGYFGMRHRAAIGLTEHIDAIALVVSEETGHISVVDQGNVNENISAHQLRQILLKEKI